MTDPRGERSMSVDRRAHTCTWNDLILRGVDGLVDSILLSHRAGDTSNVRNWYIYGKYHHVLFIPAFVS